MIRVVAKENIELKQHFAVDDNLVSRKDFIEWVEDKRRIEKLKKLQVVSLQEPVVCTIQQEWVDAQKQISSCVKIDACNNNIYVDDVFHKKSIYGIEKGIIIDNVEGNVYINGEILRRVNLYISIRGKRINKITNDLLSNYNNRIEDKGDNKLVGIRETKYYNSINEMVVEGIGVTGLSNFKLSKLDVKKIRVSWLHYINEIKAEDKIVLENFKIVQKVECGNIVEFRKMEAIAIYESTAGKVITNKMSIFNMKLVIFLLQGYDSGAVDISFIQQSWLNINRTNENIWSLNISMLGIDKGGKVLDIEQCLATDVYIDCGSVITNVSELNNRVYITFKDNRNTSKLAYSINGVERYVKVKVKFKEWKKNTCETELKKWIKKCVFITNDTKKDWVEFEIDTTIEKGEKIISKIYNFSDKVINNGRVNKT